MDGAETQVSLESGIVGSRMFSSADLAVCELIGVVLVAILEQETYEI